MLSFYFSSRSPYARKVRILLDELGTPHEPIELKPGDMDGKLFGEAYESMVPNLRVPGIKDGDQGAKEGATFIKDHMIKVTEKAFDDFAGGDPDEQLNRSIIGLS